MKPKNIMVVGEKGKGMSYRSIDFPDVWVKAKNIKAKVCPGCGGNLDVCRICYGMGIWYTWDFRKEAEE